jgi:glycosyltransferase involved in cell wall biosynthesis
MVELERELARNDRAAAQMNILFFTPARVKSAIGACSALVEAELLAQGHTVAIIRTERPELMDDPTHSFCSKTIRWTETDRIARLVRDCDAAIYQIGNNNDYHIGAVHWLDRAPGLVMLHDFFLVHLLAGWASYNQIDSSSIVARWYGSEIAELFDRLFDKSDFIDQTSFRVPMLEWICSKALAVVTHSNWGCEWVMKSCPGPVCVASLPQFSAKRPPPPRSRPHRAPGRLNILTIGQANPNKRAESVIKAIADSPVLLKGCTYRVVGHIGAERAESLSKLGERLGVDLVISGEVEETELRSALDECDIICCLRWPTLEAGSSSLVQALLWGRPTIVTDAGFYREIPDDCVIKIRPENEIDGVRSALEQLYHDESMRQGLGARGYEWCLKTFTAENYATKLAIVIEEMMRAKPVLDAVRFYSEAMRRWNSDIRLLGRADAIDSLRIFEQ